MAELLHECEHEVIGKDGATYRARVLGEERGNVWVGWLEFVASGGAATRRTQEETTQPTRAAIEYWASGLEAVYLEGALERAS
jgi:hypothetical protein